MPTFHAADAVELHYDEWGEGRTLVVLPGGAGRHPEYLGDLAGLPGRLVVHHFRGSGNSASAATVSFWEQARDLEDLRAHLGLARLDLVAHSAGTRVAVAYAARYPERVASMLLITPPVAYLTDTPWDGEEIAAHRRGDPAFDAAALATREGPRSEDQTDFERWQALTAPAGYAAWTERERAHSRIGHTELATVRAFLAATVPDDLPQRLSIPAAPVRVIAGAQDFLTGLAPVVAAAGLFPKGEVVVIDDCGHYPWVEQPDAFREAADPFVV
ncbi:alpha/beta fold hydrolase [Saccharothrix luteola]|uniref:alpha/beta fold hydrolase n=1 Tax=Saccharothrix luteola TaxID=2893018 RepID=UPI001E37911F|nr:alpha/beta hydrolase [Saccharothrix luteola]MCC8246738.1 alpha/beta hydrolase [Saccharothrix luteola]